MTTSAASAELEPGVRYTFVKLEFKPSFGLTDTGPQSEDALTAWETTLHDIYFLGGGVHDYAPFSKTRSETHWGRIKGTQNQVLIATGFVNVTKSIIRLPPLIPRNETPGVLSPLMPFLLHAPKIINVCLERPIIHRTWAFACDLNLFHIPSTDEEEKIATIKCLDSATNLFDNDDCTTDLQSCLRGRLYPPEGLARSFMDDDGADWLENKETYVHLTHWTKREASENQRDGAQENVGPGKGVLTRDWYRFSFPAIFANAASREGTVREEIQVDLKRWLELWPDDQQAEFAAKYPGSIPTHPLHGKGCKQCAPWVD